MDPCRVFYVLVCGVFDAIRERMPRDIEIDRSGERPSEQGHQVWSRSFLKYNLMRGFVDIRKGVAENGGLLNEPLIWRTTRTRLCRNIGQYLTISLNEEFMLPQLEPQAATDKPDIEEANLNMSNDRFWDSFKFNVNGVTFSRLLQLKVIIFMVVNLRKNDMYTLNRKHKVAPRMLCNFLENKNMKMVTNLWDSTEKLFTYLKNHVFKSKPGKYDSDFDLNYLRGEGPRSEMRDTEWSKALTDQISKPILLNYYSWLNDPLSEVDMAAPNYTLFEESPDDAPAVALKDLKSAMRQSLQTGIIGTNLMRALGAYRSLYQKARNDAGSLAMNGPSEAFGTVDDVRKQLRRDAKEEFGVDKADISMKR